MGRYVSRPGTSGVNPDPSRQLDLFEWSALDVPEVDEYPEGWTLDPVSTRLYRLRWERGIEVVNVAGGRL